MDQERIDRIRRHAHLLWEAAGCPHGRDEEFWLAAEAAEQGLTQPAETTAPPEDPAADPAKFAGF